MTSPPGKGTGALLHAPIAKLGLRTAYRIAAFFASMFGRPFWFAEKQRSRLQDRMDNEERQDRSDTEVHHR